MQVRWTGEFLFALAWLGLVLSVGAVFLLYVLIRRGAAAQVASLFYLVPPATAIIAYLMFDERLGLLALAGMVVTATEWRWSTGTLRRRGRRGDARRHSGEMGEDVLRIADFRRGTVDSGDLQMRTQAQFRQSGVEQPRRHRIGDRILDLRADQQGRQNRLKPER